LTCVATHLGPNRWPCLIEPSKQRARMFSWKRLFDLGKQLNRRKNNMPLKDGGEKNEKKNDHEGMTKGLTFIM
jgi:hypothetical protein